MKLIAILFRKQVHFFNSASKIFEHDAVGNTKWLLLTSVCKKNASKVYFQLKFKRIHVVGKGSRKKTEIGKFDIRKFPFKLESTNRRWRVLNAVLSYQKFSNFPTSFFTISFSTVQLPVFSNCTYSEKCLAYNYPTENFPITRYFQLNFPTSNL